MSDKDLDKKPENQQFDFKTEDIKIKKSASATDFAAVTEKGPGLAVRILRFLRAVLLKIGETIKKFVSAIRQIFNSVRGRVIIMVVAGILVLAGGAGAFFYFLHVSHKGKNKATVPTKNINELLEEESENFLEDVKNLAKKEIKEMQESGQNTRAVYYAMDVLRKLEEKNSRQDIRDIIDMVDLKKLDNANKAIFYDFLIRLSYALNDKDMEEHYERMMNELPEEDRIK